MSVEEEVELRDLVAQTLELNGCLSKIRAQLRANLFLALDEDGKITKQQPLLNNKIKTHLQVPEGHLMFNLVREFLEYFDLDFTISVFEPESYGGSCYKYEGRQKIIEDLGLKSPEDNLNDGPLLLHLIKIAQMKSKLINNNDENKETDGLSTVSSVCSEINGHSENKEIDLKKIETVEKKNLDATFVKKDAENDDTFNGTSSIEEDAVNGSENSIQQKSTEQDENVSTVSQSESSPESKSEVKKSDKLKSKLELPPLQLNKPRGSDILPSLYTKDFKEKNSKDFDFDIKDDYEEDFMSGSEVEFSLSKVDCPQALLDELSFEKLYISPIKNSENKITSSSDVIETNVSIENAVSGNSKSLD